MILQDLKILFQDSRKYGQKGHFVILFSDVPKIYFMVKDVFFFQKNQLSIGLWWRKVVKIGQKCCFLAKKDFYNECGVIMLYFSNFSTLVPRVWQYGLWSFQTGGTKFERFLPKNQHTQRKLLNFENWINGGIRSFQKSKF